VACNIRVGINTWISLIHFEEERFAINDVMLCSWPSVNNCNLMRLFL